MTTTFAEDSGTIIALDCKGDVSASTVRKIIARRPDGARVEWAAQLEGTDVLTRTLLSTDLMVGEWLFQAYVEMPAGKWFGEVVKYTVKRPL